MDPDAKLTITRLEVSKEYNRRIDEMSRDLHQASDLIDHLRNQLGYSPSVADEIVDACRPVSPPSDTSLRVVSRGPAHLALSVRCRRKSLQEGESCEH